MADELTERQAQVLAFIKDFYAEKRYPPSFKEIADHIGVTSSNAVAGHIKALEKKGFINYTKNIARGVVPADD